MSNEEPVFHPGLHETHRAAGATFEVHGGWSLPAHYGNPAAEYQALRTRAAVFDRSNRSRFLVTGTDAHVVLGRAFAGHAQELEEGRAMRAAALNEEGTIRDLALIARTGGIAYTVIGEPGQRFETLKRLQTAVGNDFEVQIDDRTQTTCLLGIAGPGTLDVMREHLAEGLPGRVEPMQCAAFQFHGFRGLAIRASDTGEDGFELMLAPAVAQHLTDTLRKAGVGLTGRTALESARVEACIPAFDPDLSTGISPAEADLDTVLGISAGAERRILSAVLFDTAEPLAPGTLLTRDGRIVGEVRSCVQAFGLNATAGLGIIDRHEALPGREFAAGASRVSVVAKPLYRRRTRE